MSTSIDICKEILNELATQKRSVAWLVKELGHDPGSLRKLLKKNDLPSRLGQYGLMIETLLQKGIYH